MKKNISLQKMSDKSVLFLGTVGTALLIVSVLGAQSALAAITSQLDFGDRGSEVTELQTYLAANPNLYPSGLVTGYFGSLTQGGVQKFQVAQNIVSNGTPVTTGYGRVGPTTMARINSLMGSGGNPLTSLDKAPIFNTPLVQTTNNSATLTWRTDEVSRGQVYYNDTPLISDEATGPRQLPYVSGNLVLDNSGLQLAHTVIISNLQPNTLYYYLIRGIDSDGNMSMTWPTTFRTN
jgi:peptidoglycan hydrolase-like protein with peptidoglycan-binding domain